MTPSSFSAQLRLPDGLKEVLEEMIREVLRAQPDDVVAFLAQHFQAQLEERERSHGAQEVAEPAGSAGAAP